MIEVLGWCFIGLLAFLFIPWAIGYALRKSNSAWYQRVCTERYLKMRYDDAIKNVLDDLYKEKKGGK